MTVVPVVVGKPIGWSTEEVRVKLPVVGGPVMEVPIEGVTVGVPVVVGKPVVEAQYLFQLWWQASSGGHRENKRMNK